jgi:hypothetical protein
MLDEEELAKRSRQEQDRQIGVIVNRCFRYAAWGLVIFFLLRWAYHTWF